MRHMVVPHKLSFNKKELLVLFRAASFLLLYALVHWVRPWYTDRMFGYRVLISDGFTRFIPYALFVVFLVVFWKKIIEVSEQVRSWKAALFWGGVSSALLFAPSGLAPTENYIDIVFLEFTLVFLVDVGFLVTIFGKNFIKKLFSEVAIVILLLVPFTLAPLLIDNFWKYSSQVALAGLRIIFPLFRIPYEMDPARFSVSMEGFTVFIGPPCAGIHSLLAFTTVYVAALLLISQRGFRLRRVRALLFFIVGLTGVFIINTFRIFLIIFVGARYSPEFATTLFHSYIGAALLIVFFLAYISFVLPKVISSRYTGSLWTCTK